MYPRSVRRGGGEAGARDGGGIGALARERVERERQGLLRAWSTPPEDAMAAARLGGRLLELFAEDAWREKAREELKLRLQRLARMFWLQRNMPARAMSAALEEVTARDLGNPFRPWRAAKMEALFHDPAPEMHVGRYLVLPELPGESVAAMSPSPKAAGGGTGATEKAVAAMSLRSAQGRPHRRSGLHPLTTIAGKWSNAWAR